MPTYDYRCPDCGHVWDELRKVAERNSARCPRCEADAELLIGPVQFKVTSPEGLITEAVAQKKYGKDWRENKASRRMARGEPEKLYFGTRKPR